MVGVPKRWEGFVAIWLRAHEEFTDNGFQLLFIYIHVDVKNKHTLAYKLISVEHGG